MDLEELVKNSNSNQIVKHISENMFGKTFHHHYHMLFDLRTLMGKDKIIYTEIGTFCGGSTSLMLHHPFNTEINCIDPLHVLTNQEQILRLNIEKFNTNNYNVNIYKKFSNDINFIKELKDKNFKTDILFIDGCHTYNGVLSDFHNYKNFVNEGGYIIFDGYLDYKYSPEVKPAIDFIVYKLDLNNYEVIGTIPNYHKSFDGGYNLDKLNEFIIRKKKIESEEQKKEDDKLTVNEPIKFIIVMATYYRQNNKTNEYLKRSLNSIINQNYQNWDLIIVGDKYEKEDELLQLISEYQNKTENKIIYINNQNVERDNVKNKMKLWHCAGATSINIGLKYARDNGYKYYSHLDDDDWWENNHLEAIKNIYEVYKNCVFVNTKSTYLKSFLPKNDIEIFENNMLPTPCGMIHSSFSFRIDIINYYYDTDLNNGINHPADALMLNKIRKFILENKQYSSVYIPKLTCHHDEEMLSINN
jgi:cephalosporin hydroxylase